MVILLQTGSVVQTRIAIAFARASDADSVKTNQRSGSHVQMPSVDHQSTHTADKSVAIVDRSSYYQR